MSKREGWVALVGAGPGDPELLTLKGRSLIARADVIVLDRLVSPAVLSAARDDVEIIDVGKTPGRHSVPQNQINGILVERALLGDKIVRLKGGDPFLYGRGFEESETCRSAGVPCEIVPGVSSALAGPAAAGIPLTLRGVARTLTITTPSNGADVASPPLADDVLAHSDTLCVLMGRSQLRTLCDRLLAHGRDPATPAALIQNATCPNQRVIRASLGTIAHEADIQGIGTPALFVIGEVAIHARSTCSDSHQTLPLAGRSIVVTRPWRASARLVQRLAALGAEPIVAPLIRIEYIDPVAWPDLRTFDWLVVTSLHGAAGLGRQLSKRGLDARALAGMKIAAVGPRTARALRRIGVRADLVPATYRARALARELCDQLGPNDRVLFACGTLALDEIPEALSKAGVSVEQLRIYDTIPNPPSDAVRTRIEQGVDAILLYSPSAAQGLAEACLDLGSAVVAAIGPTTAAAARRAGLRVDLVPTRYSDVGMVGAVVDALTQREVCA